MTQLFVLDDDLGLEASICLSDGFNRRYGPKFFILRKPLARVIDMGRGEERNPNSPVGEHRGPERLQPGFKIGMHLANERVGKARSGLALPNALICFF